MRITVALLLIVWVAPALVAGPEGAPGAGPDHTVIVGGARAEVKRTEKGDFSSMPEEFSWLLRHIRDEGEVDREEYLARWEAFADAAGKCEDPDKVRWFVHLAWLSHSAQELRQRAAMHLERMAVAQPRCLLRGMRDGPFQGMQGPIMQRYLFNPVYRSEEAMLASLGEVVGEEEFAGLAEIYAGQLEIYQRRVAREQEREARRLAQERRQHWTALQDMEFFNTNPSQYLERLEALTAAAMRCEETDLVRWFIEAAIQTGEIARLRARNAPVVEQLVLTKPACVFEALDDVRRIGGFYREWLIELPGDEGAAAIHAAVTQAVEEDSRALRAYQRVYSAYQYEIADAVRPAEEFLWSVKFARTGPGGRILVPATYIKGHDEFQEELEQLWAQTPKGEARGAFDEPLKIMPRHALDFMTLQRYGTYYLISMGRERVRIVKADVTHTAMQRWTCGGETGPIVALLALEPRTQVNWLSSDRDYYSFVPAVELRDDLPLPDVKEYDDNWEGSRFQRGRLSWPGGEKDYYFHHTQAYVRPKLYLEDAQTGEKHRLPRSPYPLCH